MDNINHEEILTQLSSLKEAIEETERELMDLGINTKYNISQEEIESKASNIVRPAAVAYFQVSAKENEKNTPQQNVVKNQVENQSIKAENVTQSVSSKPAEGIKTSVAKPVSEKQVENTNKAQTANEKQESQNIKVSSEQETGIKQSIENEVNEMPSLELPNQEKPQIATTKFKAENVEQISIPQDLSSLNFNELINLLYKLIQSNAEVAAELRNTTKEFEEQLSEEKIKLAIKQLAELIA